MKVGTKINGREVGCFTAIAWFVAFFGGGWLWRGYVTMRLWNWFVAPALHVSNISVAWALGLTTVAYAFLWPRADDPSEDDKEDTVKDIMLKGMFLVLFKPWLLFCLGYIAHRYM
jgi:hypothetical protein